VWVLKIVRKKTKRLMIGHVPIGGASAIAVQSMTNTPTSDIGSTVRQISRLQAEGCEIIRLGTPDMEAARSLGRIKEQTAIPLVADIHFNHRLALEALDQGVDGLRLNPGNIGRGSKVREVVRVALERQAPIRIGVNAGSLEKDLLEKHRGPTATAMVESAMGHVGILEDAGFDLIKISLKASDLLKTVEAYEMISGLVDYPLHVGITEAGTLLPGAVKSSVGIGLLLAQGIGDTIRVSLTAAPEEEVRTAYQILRSLGLRKRGVEIISCPTCSRTRIDLIGLAQRVERALTRVEAPLKVAVMGCEVNGPGEAKDADIGIAGGRGKGIIFKNGEKMGTYPEDELLPALLKEIDELQARERPVNE
jgi:(E)-4-hydroxy-3-methylbut-2-enyl-diphosphate synthase